MIEEMKEFFRKYRLKFALLFLVFFAAGIGLGWLTEQSLKPKGHIVSTVYTVKEGDTLIDICYEYRAMDCREPYILEFVEEIKKLNPRLVENHGQLQIGDKVQIEYLERD